MKTPHILSRSCKFNFTAHPGSLFSHPSCRHGWPNQFLSKIPYVLLQCLDYIIPMPAKAQHYPTEPSELQVTNSAE